MPTISQVGAILITGARGQLGTDLARRLPAAVASDVEDVRIEDEAAVARVFAEVRPSVVFNCAAYNAVDAAEGAGAEAAFAVNARGPEVLAAACSEVGARLVHFSTNYVFDGVESRAWTEEDAPAPLSAYGRSKLEGERRVLEVLPSALVVRVAALFGTAESAVKGGSFPFRIVERARAGGPLTVVDDQWVNPTYTGDLAEAVMPLGLDSGMTGVVHLAPLDCCTWHELAVESLRVAGVAGVPVERGVTEAREGAAARPRFGCLGSVRVAPLRSWREGVRAYFAERSG